VSLCVGEKKKATPRDIEREMDGFVE